MNYTLKENVLTIKPQGRIDSTNAADKEKEIFALCEDNAFEDLILDFDEIEYISSAGLRVVLRLRKRYQTLKVINVSSDVYEIFEMTGFTEMMPIEKGYRKLSVDGCEVIGVGANGKVYRINDDTIVKVYLSPDSLDDIKKERELAKKAFVLGIPTAISYDVAKIGDGYGSVFEMLDAKSLAQLLALNPQKIDDYVALSIDLLKKIHGTKVEKGDMPDLKKAVVDWAEFVKEYLPADIGNKLVKMVKEIPDDEHMLHGDYYVRNVMLQGEEAMLIDMDTLGVGNSIIEFGSMFNAYKGFASYDAEKSSKFLGFSSELATEFWDKSLKLYFGDSEKIAIVEKKAAIIGYMRLFRRLIRRGGLNDAESQKELAFYKERLCELIPTVDELWI